MEQLTSQMHFGLMDIPGHDAELSSLERRGQDATFGCLMSFSVDLLLSWALSHFVPRLQVQQHFAEALKCGRCVRCDVDTVDTRHGPAAYCTLYLVPFNADNVGIFETASW